MSNNNLPSSSTLRFLGLIKQPESEFNRIREPLELHESDIVWSFAAVAPDSYPHRDSTATSQPSHYDHHHRHRFNPVQSGLSAALSDDHHHLIRRKSKMISPATRQDARFPQSVPVNIPLWHKKGNVLRVDDVEGDEIEGEEEMVPPHVIVARSHVTFSVFEGAGRTLKGRDLRRVRNAVFQKTGFID